LNQGLLDRERSSQPDEDADDRDIDADGFEALEHARQHGHALFSKCIGQVTPATSPLF
jgi:hypothetical protein